ncbi:MAG: peptide-methionine (S)-S-oxide reductase MsrA [Gemmatimonadota bacterium]|nr:peptide-methionine (S)-S-oxide reductase MsrA [Gemmatimonadota bacterium]MDH3427008.1 peptide-methionine (S)-S-oxide reductase MsrA [Gemmatimonadota bacterium]
MARATFGGGCFWCLEPIFRDLVGVEDVAVGYAGGHTEYPTYRQVCETDTGHAEVVQVTFDPAVIGFRDLLDVFFSVHDPTTLNRQGADVGSQYRSIVLSHDGDQACAAEEAIEALDASGLWPNPVVTEVAPLEVFYPAEKEHQEYYARNPNAGFCRLVIDPKVAKFRKQFAEIRKESAIAD